MDRAPKNAYSAAFWIILVIISIGNVLLLAALAFHLFVQPNPNGEWLIKGFAAEVLGAMILAWQYYFKSDSKRSPQRNPDASNGITVIQQPAFKVYLNRKEIHWEKYNKAIYRRYWACGTSLIGVAENDLITRFIEKGAVDIRVILPSVGKSFMSYLQLYQYDIIETRLVSQQVEAAEKSYELIDESVRTHTEKPSDKLRLYGGVMYYNITIYDDDAFISFYDAYGVGDSNITLYCNKTTNDIGYKKIERLFMDMWNVSPNFGDINKPIGTSILFVNQTREILLVLRDNKPEIRYPNCWDILGGNVENNETPEECIVREMKEEIGIDIGNPQLFKSYDLKDRIEFTFWKKADFRIEDIKLNEGQALRWFSKNEIDKLPDPKIAFNFKPIILEFYKEKILI
jgi:8-oxo-dGTP diphosphatase